MASPAPLPAFERLSPEELADRILFFRGHGILRCAPVADGLGLSIKQVETLLCRGLSTLLARGHPAEQLCEIFRLTPEQLASAAKAPAFGTAFRPLGAWGWHDAELPDEPEAARELPASRTAAG